MWLSQMAPKIIVVGEAPSTDLDYYRGYNTITQNTAEDIVFECATGVVHVYVSSATYKVRFLTNRRLPHGDGYYIGTLKV